MPDEENHTVPAETNVSWRAWLMTGARRTPLDRRRLRGANKGLKKILLEGLTGNGDTTHQWQEFSGAMVRHAVEDAMRGLPAEDVRVVKLAYFGGYSNRQIAREVGVTEWTVQRRLRRALAAISNHIQNALVLLLSGRWLSDQLAPAMAVGGAAVIIAGAQALPGAVDQSALSPSHATANSGSVVAPAKAPTAAISTQVPSTAVPIPAVAVPKLNVQVPAELKKLLQTLRA